MVRYDEADKIMFDIIKDDWNEFGSNSNSSIRIPTLRTLPGYIEKLKGKQVNFLWWWEYENTLDANWYLFSTTSLSITFCIYGKIFESHHIQTISNKAKHTTNTQI